MRFGLACSECSCQEVETLWCLCIQTHGSLSCCSGFVLANVSFSIPCLACCCLTSGDCGRAVRPGPAPLITQLSQSPPAAWTSRGLGSAGATDIWAATTPSTTHLDSSPHLPECPSSLKAYNGMLYLPGCSPVSHSVLLSG